MNLKEYFFKKFPQNFDFVLGLLIFITYKFFFTWLLWQGRGVPPEPDDSYFYLTSASHLMSPQTFEEFRLLPFSIWLNVLSFLSGGNLESAYRLNFYIGPIIMFLALFYFLSKLEVSRIIRLFLIVILALYSGSGAYHGFYWVVPSFYQLAVFFIIAGLLIQPKIVPFWKIFLASFGFIFIHPTSILISTIFFIFTVITLLIKRETAIFKNSAKIAISLVISFAIYYLIGKSFASSGSPQSFEISANLLVGFLQGKLEPVSFQVIEKEYFAILFFHPLSVIAYFSALLLVYLSKQFKLLALYFSTMALVLISSFIPYGSRTLAFIWPLTFMIFGYAIFQLYVLMSKFTPKIKFLAVVPVVLLVTVASAFNLISVKSINLTSNYFWDRSCPEKVKRDKVGFYSHEASHAFILYGLNPLNSVFLAPERLPEIVHDGAYIVKAQTLTEPKMKLSKFEQFLTENVTRRSSNKPVNFPQNVWTQSSVDQEALEADLRGENLKLQDAVDCRYFKVQKVTKL